MSLKENIHKWECDICEEVTEGGTDLTPPKEWNEYKVALPNSFCFNYYSVCPKCIPQYPNMFKKLFQKFGVDW